MNKYISTEDEIVCVIATDKNTGYITTCTSCDIFDSSHYAKYYSCNLCRTRYFAREGKAGTI